MWIHIQNIFHKILHWEYWPWWSLYIPLVPLWVFYFFRTLKYSLIQYSNPGIRNGGLYDVSKMSVYQLLPKQSYPTTLLINPNYETPFEEVMATHNLRFPVIAKPDKGYRGILVKKINTIEELKNYWLQIDTPFLIQEFISYDNEAGVFYVWDTKKKEGIITGLTTKEFLTITGDGKKNVRQLVQSNSRFRLQVDRLEKKINLDEVPKANEMIRLEEIGNHNLGTKFKDSTSLLTEKLANTFISLAQTIPGFYYGRFDVRFSSWEEFKEGREFKIIELNGALSEPTHMYDPRHSFFYAIIELYRHHIYMLEIARDNCKRKVKVVSA